MNIQDAVSTACQNQDQIVRVLAWIGGSSLVASPLAWASAHWKILPPGLQRILELFAVNLLHFLLGEPTKSGESK